MDSDAAKGNKDLTSTLLVELRSGDSTALNTLMVRDLDWIRSYVRRNLGGVVRQHAETGDVVQEVFVRVLRGGPKFVISSRDVFRRLMSRIISNTLVTMARHYTAKARTSSRIRGPATDSVLYLDGDGPVRAATEPPVRAERDEEKEWIELAIALLDPLDQEVLHLRDFEDQPFKTVGERLGLKKDGARMRYNRAFRRLTRSVLQLRKGQLESVLTELEGESAA